MPDNEYVARVDGPLGPRGTIVSAADWAKLDVSAREEFSAREVLDVKPPAKKDATPS